MKTSVLKCAVLLAALTACGSDSGTPPTTLTLQNDAFSGGTPSFVGGLATGEGVSVSLGPQAKAYSIQKVMFVYGGNSTARTITLRINADAGTDAPGLQLASSDHAMTPSDAAMQEIELSSTPVAVAAGQRVRITLIAQHAGLPGVGMDGNGITNGRNFVYTSGTWYKAETLSVAGDFIIRAEIRTN